MEHLGDITKMHGGEIAPVDIITFGSPCQNMSAIGRRDGLEGEQSSLFYHAIRIIKEMRSATNGAFPVFALWENVMGAFSSGNRMDFKRVLEAFSGSGIPMPDSGKWAKAGMVRGKLPDIAWRLMDARYWGEPPLAQRRRRIFLVADFAAKVLLRNIPYLITMWICLKLCTAIKIGDIVLSTPNDDYAYLVGKVMHIAKLGSPEHASGNPSDDVFVDFMAFEYSPKRVTEIEEMLRCLNGDPIRMEDAALDDVIISPDNLICVNAAEAAKLDELLDSAKAAAEVYYSAMHGDVDLKVKKESVTHMDDSSEKSQGLPFQMDITARPIEPKGNLLGFASVKLNNLVTIYDLRILQGENGLFVGMPSKADPTSKTGYRNTVYVEKGFLEDFSNAVIGAYHVAQKQFHAVKISTPQKQPVKEQLKTAEKEAARHNDGIASSGRSAPSRGGR